MSGKRQRLSQILSSPMSPRPRRDDTGERQGSSASSSAANIDHHQQTSHPSDNVDAATSASVVQQVQDLSRHMGSLGVLFGTVLALYLAAVVLQLYLRPLLLAAMLALFLRPFQRRITGSVVNVLVRCVREARTQNKLEDGDEDEELTSADEAERDESVASAPPATDRTGAVNDSSAASASLHSPREPRRSASVPAGREIIQTTVTADVPSTPYIKRRRTVSVSVSTHLTEEDMRRRPPALVISSLLWVLLQGIVDCICWFPTPLPLLHVVLEFLLQFFFGESDSDSTTAPQASTDDEDDDGSARHQSSSGSTRSVIVEWIHWIMVCVSDALHLRREHHRKRRRNTQVARRHAAHHPSHALRNGPEQRPPPLLSHRHNEYVEPITLRHRRRQRASRAKSDGRTKVLLMACGLVAFGLILVQVTAVTQYHHILLDIYSHVQSSVVAAFMARPMPSTGLQPSMTMTAMITTSVWAGTIVLVVMATVGALVYENYALVRVLITTVMIIVPTVALLNFLLIPGVASMASIAFLAYGTNRLFLILLPKRPSWSHIAALFACIAIMEFRSRAALLITLVVWSSMSTVTQLAIYIARIIAESRQAELSNQASPVHSRRSGSPFESSNQPSGTRPLRRRLVDEMAQSSELGSHASSSSTREGGHNTRAGAEEETKQADRSNRSDKNQFWTNGIPEPLKRVIWAYAKYETSWTEQDIFSLVSQATSLALVVGGVLGATMMVTFMGLRVTTDVALLSKSSTDAIAQYPVWERDWWQSLNDSTPWEFMEVPPEQRDLKNMTKAMVQQGQEWVMSRGREHFVGFVHTNVFHEAVNESEIDALIDRVVEHFRKDKGGPQEEGFSITALLRVVYDFFAQQRGEDETSSPWSWLLMSLSSVVKDVGPYLWGLVKFNTNLLWEVLGTMQHTLTTVIDLLLTSTMLFTALFNLLLIEGSESGMISMVTGTLFQFQDTQRRQQFDTAVVLLVRHVLRFTFKIPIFHIAFTWFLYLIFGVSGGLGGCFWAILSAMVSVLALLPGWLFAIPGVLELWFRGFPVLALCFLLTVMLAEMQLVPLIMAQRASDADDSDVTDTAATSDPDSRGGVDHGEIQVDVPKFVIGLSIYSGWWVTGSIEGIVLGPLVVSILLVIKGLVLDAQ